MTEREKWLIETDLVADILQRKLEAAGIGLLQSPMKFRPGILWFAARRMDDDLRRRLNTVGMHLTEEARVRFHAERCNGQGYSDATGFWLRCWAAAFALPFLDAYDSRSAP